jgi:hypothetical protein
VGTGPDERAGRGHLRAGHDDREQVISQLKAAFVQGRLDQGELEERAARAVASRTYAELAALTADIPAPAPVTASTAGLSSPGRTLARAAKRAGICLLIAVALMEAAFLTENFLLIVMATFAALGTAGFLGYGILDAWQERRTRDRPAPGPDPGTGGPGSAGGPPVREPLPPGRGPVPPGLGPVPPVRRGDLNRAEARARPPRPAGGLQRGWAVS